MSSTKTYLQCPQGTLTCPWCKTTKHLEIVLEDPGFISNLNYRVTCKKCGIHGPRDHLEKEAIKKWDNRNTT